jgi:hypothetical protein
MEIKKACYKVDSRFCIRAYIIFFNVFICISNALALEALSIDVKQIATKDWQLKNVSFKLFDLHNQPQQFGVSIEQLSLPEPFDKLSFFSVQCPTFSWQENQIECKKGKANLKSSAHHLSPFDFSFSISEDQSLFSIQNFNFAKGTLSLTAIQQGDSWIVTIKPKNVKLHVLLHHFAKADMPIDEIGRGNISADINLKGNSEGFNNFIIKAFINNLSLQANKGQIATESLSLKLELKAKFINGTWQWQNNNHIKKGELYIDPVYLEIKDKGVNISSKGRWNERENIVIQQLKLTHPGAIGLTADGLVKFHPEFTVNKAHIKLDIEDLDYFASHYISPFIEQTPVENIKLNGQLKSEINVDKNEIKQVSSHFNHLTAVEHDKRFILKNSEGELNWSSASDFMTPSYIRWEGLKIRAIPIDSGQLNFLLKDKTFQLLEQTRISLLDGTIDIKQFEIQNRIDDEPSVFFEGGIKHISLEKLSQAFDWIPLSGNISGYIPGVSYENKTLTIQGELIAKAFDGTITISKLASSGILTDFSKFDLSIVFDNLDLHALTQKFQIGEIEGRLSGFINDLYLENWEPVTFFAWLGTPENDDSRHRISQKAVENIASIGGGGAADVFSRGFLRFFDTFSYDSLGFGCSLKNGVCQLMGVEAAEHGYYIIKGGGLPPWIDVMGYNTRLDWEVLMESLSRISTSDEVIVQ